MTGPDFFISYTGVDRAWAEWIAWQLETAGYATVLQAWDFAAGGDFVQQMHQVLTTAARTVAVLSDAYLASAFAEAEWRAVFAADPAGHERRLLPVRVTPCTPSGLLRTRVYVDLIGLNEAAARSRLLAGVRSDPRPGRPAVAPRFPGVPAAVAAPFPGREPALFSQTLTGSTAVAHGPVQPACRTATVEPDLRRRRTRRGRHAEVHERVRGPRPSVTHVLKHGLGVTAVAFSPDGDWLATGSIDGNARIWDARSGREHLRLAHNGPVWNVTFSPDGRWLATGSLYGDLSARQVRSAIGSDHSARIWDIYRGIEHSHFPHGGEVWRVAFSRDGRWLATASRDQVARIWDAENGTQHGRLRHDGAVCGVAFSPDGRWLATASRDHMARIWDADSGSEHTRLRHEHEVWDVAFSPDGRWLATASYDFITRVWDARVGSMHGRLRHDDRVWDLAFSPDGRWLATASRDGMARIWDAEFVK